MASIGDRDDGMAHELQRQLDAFMATYAHSLAACIATTNDVKSRLGMRSVSSQTGSAVPSPSFASVSPSASSSSCDPEAAMPEFAAPLERLEWVCATFARRRFCEVVQVLLHWLAAGEATSKIASWVCAHLLLSIFQEIYEKELAAKPEADKIDTTMELLLEKCLEVFQEAHRAEYTRSPESTSFFTFKSTQTAKLQQPTETVLMERIAAKWRSVVACTARRSLNPIRLRIQQELAKPTLLSTKTGSGVHTKAHPFVKNFSELRLGLTTRSLLHETPVPFAQRLKDAALFLKTLHPLLQKPTKSYIRLGMIALVAAILQRELTQMDQKSLQVVYTAAHVSEWNSAISELHALAMKSCSKRDFLATGWELRVAVLCLAPNDIFSRYWKDDVHSLLRLQYQHNKDGGASASGNIAVSTLECIGLCFSQLLRRHFLIERKMPNELDCMEIINTTQAWCFFSFPKQKSLQKFKERSLPVLVTITLGIAAYNMTYAVQSHLRRLLMEAESIFDEKKLVGLESLLAICRQCMGPSEREPASSRPALVLDKKTLSAHHHALGDLVGHILIECNTNFGHELLIDTNKVVGLSTSTLSGGGSILSQHSASSSSTLLSARYMRDDYKRALAIQTYGAALCSLEFVHTALELSEDQKMMLLARASIHVEKYVRQCAHHALHCIVTLETGTRQAGVVFRGLTDYVLRMTGNQANNHDLEASIILVRLIGSLLQATAADSDDRERVACWDSGKARDESLLQVDAVCVYLLIDDDAELRRWVLETLQIVRSVRQASIPPDSSSTRRKLCVLDVVDTMECELQQTFFSFLPHHEIERIRCGEKGARGGGFFSHLASDSSSPRRSFRWSMVLSMLFSRLVRCLPEVTVYIWSDVNDKILKLEPMLPLTSSMGESELGGSADLVRWRNLSIVATSTACSNLTAAASSLTSSYGGGSYRSEQDATTQSATASVQSVISASAVGSLLKRLGRYLKSFSLEHRKAAILALGSSHPSAFSMLMEVLGKYEGEAFGISSGTGNSHQQHHQQQRSGDAGSGFTASPSSAHTPSHTRVSMLASANRKQFRLSKVKHPMKGGMHFQLQWALGRIYRLLLERKSRQHQQQIWKPRDTATSEDDATLLHRMMLTPSEEDGHALRPESDGRFLHRARAFLDNMSTSLEKNGTFLAIDAGALLFMMQQDFCSGVNALLRVNRDDPGSYHSLPSNDSVASPSLSSSPLLPDNVRERLFFQVMSWCPSFGVLATNNMGLHVDASAFFTFASPQRTVWMQHCDVFGESHCWSAVTTQRSSEQEAGNEEDLVTTPWHWLDEVDVSTLDDAVSEKETHAPFGACQRYFMCQSVFATMHALLASGPVFFPSPILSDTPVLRWLDESASVDASCGFPHFQPLQTICMHALDVLLRKDFHIFGPICMEKALFTQPEGDKLTLAKKYFAAFSDHVDAFQKLWSSRDEAAQQQLLARLFHVTILHLGIEDDEPHRVVAFRRLKKLLGDPILVPNNGDFLLDSLLQQHGFSSSASKVLPVLLTQVTNRMQLTVSALLASHFQSLALVMSTSMLRFVSGCEVTQQRKLFAATLPWLAEVHLQSAQESKGSHGNDGNEEMSEPSLLSLLFRLTKNLSSSCSEQLEHAWSTLAFTSSATRKQQHIRSEGCSSNLSRILAFLFLQRTSTLHIATSKTVFWWLCRWQSAAFEVIFTLVDHVNTRRRRSSSVGAIESRASDSALLQPMTDIAMLLMLVSDSCCHLVVSLLHDAAFKEMTIQIIHFAFLVLYSTLEQQPTSMLWEPTHGASCDAAPPGGTHCFETAEVHLVEDIARDCMLVLRNMLPLLQPPSQLAVDAVLGDLSSLVLPHLQRDPSSSQPHCQQHRFESVMTQYMGSCLSSSEIMIWSEECVKEFLLAISLYNGGNAYGTMSVGKAKLQGVLCLRFALVAHRLLAPPFHGDVFLSLMELLHHSLDEQNRDPGNTNALVHDCLITLSTMVKAMAVSKLVLYPQILWVCLALLNHCRNLPFHDQVVDLLLEILSKPYFFTHVILHDVLLSKRPRHWSKAQSSVLRAVVLNMHSGDDASRHMRAQHIVGQAILLPCPVLRTNPHEHAVICTIALMPMLGSACGSGGQSRPVALDLSCLWRSVDCESASIIGDLLEQYAVSELARCPSPETGNRTGISRTDEVVHRGFLTSFASAFVQYIHARLENDASFDPLSVCFETLSVAASASGRKRNSTEEEGGQGAHGVVHVAALFLMEKLLQEMETRQVSWKPPSSLIASLARLVRSAQQSYEWEAAVRIMSYLAVPTAAEGDTRGTSFCSSNPPSSSSSDVQSKPHLTITTSPSDTSSSANGGGNRSAMSPKAPKAGATAPTSIKKDSLQTARTKIMNLMTRRTDSSPHSDNNTSNNNNNSTNENSTTSSGGSSTSIVGGNPALETQEETNSAQKTASHLRGGASEGCASPTPSRSKLFRS